MQFYLFHIKEKIIKNANYAYYRIICTNTNYNFIVVGAKFQKVSNIISKFESIKIIKTIINEVQTTFHQCRYDSYITLEE